MYFLIDGWNSANLKMNHLSRRNTMPILSKYAYMPGNNGDGADDNDEPPKSEEKSLD